jgi:hypothetical protein
MHRVLWVPPECPVVETIESGYGYGFSPKVMWSVDLNGAEKFGLARTCRVGDVLSFASGREGRYEDGMAIREISTGVFEIMFEDWGGGATWDSMD